MIAPMTTCSNTKIRTPSPLPLYYAVYPTHGQWPAPMGSWRVFYFIEHVEYSTKCSHCEDDCPDGDDVNFFTFRHKSFSQADVSKIYTSLGTSYINSPCIIMVPC